MAYRALIFGLLMANWLIFSGKFDLVHITYGVISAAFVTWLSEDLLFSNRKVSLGQRFKQGIAMAKYSVWLVYQIFIANLHILRLAMTPGGMKEVQPTVIRYRTPLKSDFAKFLLANSITLTPGTVTARIEGDHLYVHSISQISADGINGDMDKRVGAIFGENEEEEKAS